MSRVVPVLIAVVAIVALTIVEGSMSARWGDNRLSAYCAVLLDDVPTQIGQWVGEDGDVDEVVQMTAGARGFVSRTYRNETTGEVVGVWLIVGHARDTARHTPDVCYGGSGFKPDEEGITKHHQTFDGVGDASFWTAEFVRQSGLGEQHERVFWAWFKPQSGSGESVEWIAPDNVRYEIGAAPALYKLYFTTTGSKASDADAESVCMEFAKEFLPVVAEKLAPANGEIPADFDASTVEEV